MRPSSGLDDVASIINDLAFTAKRLDSRFLLSDTVFGQWESSKKTRKLINNTEETTRNIQSLVKRLSRKVDLPDFGSVAVVSCWALGASSETSEMNGTRSEQLHNVSELRPEAMLQIDERGLGGSNTMERVELADVDEQGTYRGTELRTCFGPCNSGTSNTFLGICKLCVTLIVEDKTEFVNGTGWLIDNSTVVTAAHMLYGTLTRLMHAM